MIKLITRVALWILRKIRKDQKEQKEEKATITKPTDKPSLKDRMKPLKSF